MALTIENHTFHSYQELSENFLKIFENCAAHNRFDIKVYINELSFAFSSPIFYEHIDSKNFFNEMLNFLFFSKESKEFESCISIVEIEINKDKDKKYSNHKNHRITIAINEYNEILDNYFINYYTAKENYDIDILSNEDYNLKPKNLNLNNPFIQKMYFTNIQVNKQSIDFEEFKLTEFHNENPVGSNLIAHLLMENFLLKKGVNLLYEEMEEMKDMKKEMENMNSSFERDVSNLQSQIDNLSHELYYLKQD